MQPYSTTAASPGELDTFTKGIWKSVYLSGISPASASIEAVVPHVFYNGSYPTSPLADGNHGDFTVRVKVALHAPVATTGTLSVTGGWAGATASTPVSLPAGSTDVTLTLLATGNSVALWWPNGMGAQALYGVNVTFTPTAAGSVPITARRRIGFRVVAIVSGNDTVPSTLAGVDGSGNFTMRIKVNGANMWARGANMIPMGAFLCCCFDT